MASGESTQEYLGKPLSPEINIVPLGTDEDVVKFSLCGKSGKDYILSIDNQETDKLNNSIGADSDADFFSEPDIATPNQKNGDKRNYFSDSELGLEQMNQLSNSQFHKNENFSASKVMHVVSDPNEIYREDVSNDPVTINRPKSSTNTKQQFIPEIFNTNGKSRIILIKSTNNLNIFSNPTLTLKYLEDSGLNKIKCGPHEVQGRGGCLKLKINTRNDFDISKVSKMGENPVRAWYPVSDNHSYGVIFPIDKKISLNEIGNNLKVIDSINTTVVELKRIQSKNNPTDLVKLTFDGPLPNKVIISGQTYIVRRYNKDPLICYRCSRWGHGVISCTGSARCGHCGGNHFLKECDKRDISPKCLHCKNEHITGSRFCLYYKEAAKIENLKSTKKISYDESKRYYNDLNKCSVSDIINFTTYENSNNQNFKTNLPTRSRHQSESSDWVDINKPCYETSNPFEILSENLEDKFQRIMNEIESPPTVTNHQSYSSALKSNHKSPKNKNNNSSKSQKPILNTILDSTTLDSLDLIDPDNYNNSTTRIFNNSNYIKNNEAKSKLDPQTRNELKQKLTEKIKSTNMNNKPLEKQTNFSFNSSNVNSENQQSNNQFSNSTCFFWFSISKMILEFLNLKEKSLEKFCTFGWKILEKVANHFNFDL